MSRPLRVLHCPASVGGNPGSLARAEREVGLDSWAVAFEPVHMGYTVDEVLFESVRGGRLGRELKRWALLRRALRSFDVVHFNFGSSILPKAYPRGLGPATETGRRTLFQLYARSLQLRDLGWLKRAGKGVAVTFQGDDARQTDYCRTHFEISMPGLPDPSEDEELDRRRRTWISAFDRHADRIYALNPDLLHVLPARAEFLPYASVDPRLWLPSDEDDGVRPPRVLHAPTDPLRKGTGLVLEAVERLRSDGVTFEFELVEGPIARDLALDSYRRADLLVDQLLAGWYGGLAVELMALGKPVIAYIRRDDLDRVPAEMRDELPIVEATPGTIYDVLKELLTTRRAELPALGRRSRAFVERWHDPLAIARRLAGDYGAIASAP